MGCPLPTHCGVVMVVILFVGLIAVVVEGLVVIGFVAVAFVAVAGCDCWGRLAVGSDDVDEVVVIDVTVGKPCARLVGRFVIGGIGVGAAVGRLIVVVDVIGFVVVVEGIGLVEVDCCGVAVVVVVLVVFVPVVVVIGLVCGSFDTDLTVGAIGSFCCVEKLVGVVEADN